MRIKIIVLLFGVSFLAIAPNVFAHSIVRDASNKTGTVIHFAPSDDPVALETTEIFYEVNTKENLSKSSVQLIIAEESGGIREDIPVVVKGKSISAFFVFLMKGHYTLKLSIGQPHDLVFTSNVDVLTSLHGANSSPVIPFWPRAGLLLSAWILVFLLGMAITHRKSIVANGR